MRRGTSVRRWSTLIVTLAATATIVATCTMGSSGAPSSSGVPSALPTGSGDACAVLPIKGVPPSNTLVNMTVDSDATSDRITFIFGASAAEPTGGTSRLEVVTPPFTRSGSGAVVEVEGSRYVQMHLDGMLIAEESGKAVFQGSTSSKPALVALKDIEETDGFEGVYNFVIGFDGSGCVGLAEDSAGGILTVTIEH